MRRNWDGTEWTGGEDNWYTDHGEQDRERAYNRLRLHNVLPMGVHDDAVRRFEGKPIKEIVGLTGLVYNSLWTAAKRAGTKHPITQKERRIEVAQTEEQKLEIAEYVKAHSVRDTEKEFNVCHRTIRAIAKELGVTVYHKKPRVREIVRAHPGLTSSQISQKFGLNHRSVKSARWEIDNPKERKKPSRARAYLILNNGATLLPLTVVSNPYRYLGETVVDLEGLTGIHRGVPVASIQAIVLGL